MKNLGLKNNAKDIANLEDIKTPSNMATTDSAQTISGAKTFTKTTTFQNDIKANGSVGTLGQVLMSQGASNSPKWGDIPAPSNVVTIDTEQTITGLKTFTYGINANSNVVVGTGTYPRTTISRYTGVEAFFSETVGTRYYANGIQKVAGSTTYTISIPDKTGTLALTSDIPTLYLAQGEIITQGGDSFYTPAVPCTAGNIGWKEYYALFPEEIPVNIVFREDNDVILVTSISIADENGTAVIASAKETNLTTGVTTEVLPLAYSLGELMINDIYA